MRGCTCSIAVDGDLAFSILGVVLYGDFVFIILTLGSIYNSVSTQSCVSVAVRQSLMEVMIMNSGREM